MAAKDFPFAVQLANTMNWNMAEEDFEFMIKLEPKGCFVLFHGSERLGIATSISYGKVGWFGNLIVKEEYRKEGAGTFLVRHAADYLKNKGAETIGLYAYQHLKEFYESLGFECNLDFSVMNAKMVSATPEGMVREAGKRDLLALAEFDSQFFGSSRSRLLEAIIGIGKNLCYFSIENDEIIGYVAARVYDEMAEVGPLVCHPHRLETAKNLLNTTLNKLSSLEVFMCLPTKEEGLLPMLSKAGFQEEFRVTRMFLGPATAKNCVYMAESLERG